MTTIADVEALMASLCNPQDIVFSVRAICSASDVLALNSEASANLLGEEHRIFNHIHSNKRKAEFCAGRIAAKAVLASPRFGLDRQILEISRDSLGAPRPNIRGSIRISISHSGRFAVAVGANYCVGVDLERNEERPRAFADFFLSDRERADLDKVGSSDRNTFINQLWSRKEAACKVGGWGASLALRDIDCSQSITQISDRVIHLASGMRQSFVASVAYETSQQMALGAHRTLRAVEHGYGGCPTREVIHRECVSQSRADTHADDRHGANWLLSRDVQDG